ncbi:hypothetical protein ACP70R_001954 [Stipagrostis hirtigluma subsp. patula]
MEVVTGVMTGALPSVLAKLGELLVGEYNLQKEAKEGITYLQTELNNMKGALEDISKVPADQLPSNDKIWASNVRELSYDIEDNIDRFMIQCKSNKPTKQHGVKKFIHRSLDLVMQPKIHRKFATDIRDIKRSVIEVHQRRCRYEVKHSVDEPVKVDPRMLDLFKKATELVGIDESRDALIKMVMEGDEAVSNKKGKIVSIFGFGGLGKTTIANAVYEKLKTQFDCWAFVSVSQTPNMKRILKDMLSDLGRTINEELDERRLIILLQDFLRHKRYFIIIDDVWNISHWNVIRCALPESDGYRIITTTRIFTVAEKIGGPYEMKPLSIENSRILMYGRIFGEEYKEKCPDEELEEVSNRILKKCAGVPLAIITIASLLVNKGRDKLEWYDVCKSIGSGLTVDSSMENMKKILSLSYFDMPSHLRTCLLYLSVFPEDCRIGKDRLIWSWIAQGFIQSRNQEKRLFGIGESYFNELINRSMIQPVYGDYSGMIEHCRVHDVVLDLICSLSSEENFVTIDNVVVDTSVPRKVRRLSLQNGKKDCGKCEASMNMEHVRSVVVFPPAIDLMSALQQFRVLRVLDLEDCYISQGYSLKCLGNLLHLRYLGLRNTWINQLPEQVGNLEFLQTLDIQFTEVSSLPSTIVQLTHLMCLRINSGTRVPHGIGSLTSIEVLSELCITDDSTDIIKELGKLIELRELEIIITAKWNDSLDKSLKECLDKLQKIQSLFIWHPSDSIWKNCWENLNGRGNLDGWVPTAPRHLRRLWFREGCWFSTLPVWLNPSLLQDLSLQISVKWLQQEGLEILGRLPALRYLNLTVDNQELGIHGRFAVVASSFPCLSSCCLWGFGGRVVFQQGAMPRVTELGLGFPAREMEELNGRLDLGLENLLSLQKVEVWFESEGASEEKVKEAKAAVMHAVRIHPNHHCQLRIDGWPVAVESDSGEDSVGGSGTDEDED